LPLARLRPNLHGASGAAIGYETPACDEVTFARLFRQEGCYSMLVGQGRILARDESSKYDDPWPHTRLSFGYDMTGLFKAIPCNHGSLTRGYLAREIEAVCAHADIPVFRCDDETGLRELLGSRGSGWRAQASSRRS
jgi:L-fucose isomerase-like protein